VVVAAVGVALLGGSLATALASRASPALEHRARGIVDPLGDESVRLRLTTWKESLSAIGGRPLGVGLGSVGRASTLRGGPAVTTDNSFLALARSEGVVLAALFLLGLLAACIATARACRRAAPSDAPVAVAALAGFVSFAILGLAGEYVEQPGKVVAWALLGLAMGYAFGFPGRQPR
jgi:O-antigen ligase